jgi:hypothetical protein
VKTDAVMRCVVQTIVGMVAALTVAMCFQSR